MGRFGAIAARRRALVGLVVVATLALAACFPLKPHPPKRPAAPGAAFSVSTAPMVASFTDQSTGLIKVRSWDFGDGETSTEQNPTHTYASHGVYAVSLTVTGPGGTDAETQNVSITPPPPVASFTTEPPSGTVPLTVTLTDTSTGIIDSVTWDLDADGVYDDATGPTATYTFDTAGNHTVALSVTGPGGTSTTSQTIPASLPPPPVASFTAVPTSGVAPLTVQFTDTSSGDITTRSWDFDGDGVTDDATQSPAHVFADPGSYQVTLTVTGLGGSNSTNQTITVNVPPPVASFTASPSGGFAPLAVNFADTSTGDITSRSWNFGDGTTSSTQNPSHTYTAAGIYTATLTVTGPGGSDSATRAILVSTPGDPGDCGGRRCIPDDPGDDPPTRL